MFRWFMRINFYFQKVNKIDHEKLKNYLTEKKLSRLVRLLQHGNLELANLVVRTQYFQRHNAFDIKLNLSFAKKELIGKEKSHDLIRAFDLALDRLISQLRKIESVRHDK